MSVRAPRSLRCVYHHRRLPVMFSAYVFSSRKLAYSRSHFAKRDANCRASRFVRILGTPQVSCQSARPASVFGCNERYMRASLSTWKWHRCIATSGHRAFRQAKIAVCPSQTTTAGFGRDESRACHEVAVSLDANDHMTRFPSARAMSTMSECLWM